MTRSTYWLSLPIAILLSWFLIDIFSSILGGVGILPAFIVDFLTGRFVRTVICSWIGLEE